jgi:Tol biopolymer transport system component
VITADDRYVLFLAPVSGFQAPWLVPIEGGEPTQVANIPALSFSLDASPDSKSIVFRTSDEQGRRSLVICDLPSCASRRDLPEPRFSSGGGRVRWTPDGRGIAYIGPQSNIWIQPLDGSAPRPLTQFTDGRTIDDFAWSHDGTRLAVSRLSVSNDIVLFRGLR